MANEQNIEFDVETSDYREYRSFIESLRRLFGRRSSHNRPVCVEQVQPSQWQDITLRTNTSSVVVRLRMANLYLDGYQMENREWLEFDNAENPGTHLISNSTYLGFTGHYQHLSRVARTDMDRVSMGQQPLIEAVNQLASTTIMRDRARSLIVVIQMICESMRFIPISNHLSNTYRDGVTISSWMLTLERSWGTLSALLLRADAYPQQSFTLPHHNGIQLPASIHPVRQIRTISDVITVLGILLGLCFRPGPSGRYPRAVNNSREQCLLGRPLVEVFSVAVNNIDGENPGQLYGTVAIISGLCLQYIFNRTRYVPQSISPGEAAYLSGPSKSILAYDSFVIDVLLTDRDPWWSPDDEVSKGQIIWDVYRPPNEYDKPISTEVKGKYGSVNVNYIVLSDAVAARVTITLKDGDGENVAQVYGDIHTWVGDFSGKDEKIVLFQQSDNEYEEVREGYTIQLRRSIVAVPIDSSLKVFARLYDHDTLSPDDEIANGTATFPAQLSGTSIQRIDGKYGNIEVAVVWNFDI